MKEIISIWIQKNPIGNTALLIFFLFSIIILISISLQFCALSGKPLEYHGSTLGIIKSDYYENAAKGIVADTDGVIKYLTQE